MSNQLSELLFQRMNETGLKYAVLRNYQTLPHDLGGSDLDLWVDGADTRRFFATMGEVAKDTDARLVSYLPSNNCPKICYANISNGIQIDVFKGCIPYRNHSLIDGNVINGNVKVYNDIKVLDDRLGNLIAAVKEIVNNGTVTEKYTKPLYVNTKDYNLEYVSRCLKHLGSQFCSLFVNSIEERDLEGNAKRLRQFARKDLS